MKSLKLTGLLFALFIGVNNSNAQEVLSTAGGTMNNTRNSLQYTIGELVAIETFSSPRVILTQGFEQTTKIHTGVSVINNKGVSVATFPNPAVDVLHVKYNSSINARVLTFSLYDVSGKLVRTYNLDNKSDREFELTLNDITSGPYFLEYPYFMDGTSAPAKGIEKILVTK